jgi:hypothetical protein
MGYVATGARYGRPERSVLGHAAGIGMAVCGVIGAVSGLIVGLTVHPLTAPFAMAEVGMPAAVLGGVIGLVVGLAIKAVGAISARSGG